MQSTHTIPQSPPTVTPSGRTYTPPANCRRDWTEQKREMHFLGPEVRDAYNLMVEQWRYGHQQRSLIPGYPVADEDERAAEHCYLHTLKTAITKALAAGKVEDLRRYAPLDGHVERALREGGIEPEPCEYSLADVDGYERTGSGDVSHPDAFDAWLEVERTRG